MSHHSHVWAELSLGSPGGLPGGSDGQGDGLKGSKSLSCWWEVADMSRLKGVDPSHMAASLEDRGDSDGAGPGCETFSCAVEVHSWAG